LASFGFIRVRPVESVFTSHDGGLQQLEVLQTFVLQQQLQIIQKIAAPIIAPPTNVDTKMVILFFMVIELQG
jgi:hypothetical protein